jgi:hypothetical protein
MQLVSTDKVCRHIGDCLADAGDDMIDALHELIHAREFATRTHLKLDEHVVEVNFDAMILAQALGVRTMSSLLMQIGRSHGARYWNIGVSFHDKLDHWAKLYHVELGQPDEL